MFLKNISDRTEFSKHSEHSKNLTRQSFVWYNKSMKTKTKLDYTLNTAEERLEALPVTMSEREAEYYANYVLYADHENKRYGLKTRWDGEAMTIGEEGYTIIFPKQHRKLSRKTVMAKPNFSKYQDLWFSLWKEIDRTEAIIALAREKDLRPKLLERLGYCRIDPMDLIPEAKGLTEQETNNLRVHLIQLRTLQYTYLDALVNGTEHSFSVMAAKGGWYEALTGFRTVLPFQTMDLYHEGYTKAELQQTDWALKALMELDAQDKIPSNRSNGYAFDFRKAEHVQSLIDLFLDLEDVLAKAEVDNETSLMAIPQAMYDYLLLYAEEANLSDAQALVFKGKCLQESNTQIQAKIKQTLGINYSLQYISTIFTKQVVAKIVAAAEKHVRELEFVTYGPQVFKRCSCCGKYYPRNTDYFKKRSTRADGFMGICRKCRGEAAKENKEK